MAIQLAIISCGGMANGHLNAYLTITVHGRVCQFEDLSVTKAGEILKNEQGGTFNCPSRNAL